MVSSGSSATWLSLFEEKKQTVNESLGSGYGLPGAVCSGRSFRAALEGIDKKKRIHKASRLDAKLLPTYKSITELSNAVRYSAADLQDLPPNDDLEALVWWTSFALIEVSKLRHTRPLTLGHARTRHFRELELNQQTRR